MVVTNYLTPNLSINNYNIYIRFKDFLYDKKYNLNYTHIIVNILIKCSLYFRFIKFFYLSNLLYNYSITKNFLHRSIYFFNLHKCKFIDSIFYSNIRNIHNFNLNKISIPFFEVNSADINTSNYSHKYSIYSYNYNYYFFKKIYKIPSNYNKLLLYNSIFLYYNILLLLMKKKKG